MQVLATLLIAATAVVAQQVGSESGPSISGGPAAVSNPNVNNGWQSQNSLFNKGSDGGNVFDHLWGNSFSKAISNSAVNDNNMINPSTSHIMGNAGDTANGRGNHIGDFVAGHGFRRRDVVFNNDYDHHHHGHYGPARVVYHPGYSRPVVFVDPIAVPAHVHHGYDHDRYGYHHHHHGNHNVQDATIIQNQA